MKAKKQLKKRRKMKVSTAQNRADKAFSGFIRYRDDFTCFTCGEVDETARVDEISGRAISAHDCGHLISRSRGVVRYDELNAHDQCKGCNIAHDTDYEPYRAKFITTYGQAAYDELYIRSRETAPLTVTEYLVIEELYKQKLASLIEFNLVKEYI